MAAHPRRSTIHNLHEECPKALGGYWKNDGRDIFDEPANWNYCGKNWTAGRNPNNMQPGEEYTLRPEPANDPRQWRNRPDNIKDGITMRKRVIFWFKYVP